MTEVFQLSNLPEGHSHQIDHGEYKVLLTNVGGEVYAVESKCSHFALPLENAALCGHRLRCPFHHACFDVRTGAQLEAPGLDGLATFKVAVKDGAIHVADEPTPAPGAPSAPGSEPPISAPASAPKQFDYLLIGGGVAAANAVYGIREEDPTGSIGMITQEDLPPYDRTHVSKALMAGDKEVPDLPLHGELFYAERGVTLLEKTVVEVADVQRKTVKTKGGDTYTYQKLLLATGGTPRRLEVEGGKLGNVYTVRNARDARRLRESVKKGTHVVVVGGSFIGLESAMSLGKQGGKITVVTPEAALFEGPFGERIGRWVQSLHEEEGVRFRLGRKVEKLEGQGKVSSVTLDNGDRLKADVVVVGIGVVPATHYLQGLAGTDDGGIKVDNHLAANAADVWVAGDIAQYPDRSGSVRIEHWKVAAQQGRVAGRNMAGRTEAYTAVPFFWSNQQGVNIRYVGHAEKYDSITFDGTPGEGPFIAYYLDGDRVLAALGVKRDSDVAAIGELMALEKLPPTGDLVGTDWQAALRKA